jgi:hypothetical protein
MSAPEFDGQPMTKREVLIAREAVDAVSRYLAARGYFNVGSPVGIKESPQREIQDLAASRYPLPKLTRPRVVAEDSGDWEYRVAGGVVECRWLRNRTPGASYFGEVNPAGDGIRLDVTADRVALWADLLANPTEEVDA